VLDEFVPAGWHHVEQYADNPTELITAGSNEVPNSTTVMGRLARR
jgi:hypothetical protein